MLLHDLNLSRYHYKGYSLKVKVMDIKLVILVIGHSFAVTYLSSLI